MTCCNCQLIEALERINQTLKERLSAIEALLIPPLRAPPPITVWRMISERKENDMFLITFEADLPPIADTPKNKDVAFHRVATLVDGEETSTQDLPRLATTVTFEVEKGKSVTLRHSYIDDDNNEGPFVESQTFVAADTVPPDAPGPFGEIRNLGEREVT